MTCTPAAYLVIEKTGHNGEFVWPRRFPSFKEAAAFIASNYRLVEISRLSVQIVACQSNGALARQF